MGQLVRLALECRVEDVMLVEGDEQAIASAFWAISQNGFAEILVWPLTSANRYA
jgi:hypothetical protein